ncbi:C40 family peptidase [Crocinitomix catalasitica]|uniref:C40 family peptidase n=1 Tax=Crocinitomix catalasitica TaxID=184607 RepID=UPI000685AFD3|nr:C40 family peptidase [Crocinitomix catalasitica]
MRQLLFFGFLFITLTSFGQDKKIDKLEMLYDQAHYTKVIRNSNRLLADPNYDYSGMPSYYKSLATFRLFEEDTHFKKHSADIFEAIELYQNFLENEKVEDYIFAHYFEIASLKTYLDQIQVKLEEKQLKKEALALDNFRNKELKEVNARPDYRPKKLSPKATLPEPKITKIEAAEGDYRDAMVDYSRSLIGTKYAWSGRDTKGFDCSGLVGHVYQKSGILIPRTASAQMNDAKKVDVKNAQKGDLLFFGSGKNISHVGLVISEKGEPLVMIHSSTSKGVIITEIDQSNYWRPKLKGAGTYL